MAQRGSAPTYDRTGLSHDGRSYRAGLAWVIVAVAWSQRGRTPVIAVPQE